MGHHQYAEQKDGASLDPWWTQTFTTKPPPGETPASYRQADFEERRGERAPKREEMPDAYMKFYPS